LRGKEAREQINILGDDGVPIDFHERFWKSELIDFVILQQDAFDKIDASTPMNRQVFMLEKVLGIANTDYNFGNFDEVSDFFKRVINHFKQMNYSEFKSEKFNKFDLELADIIKSRVN
jgi:V/A-type H+-transporting ATPase subunit A